MNIKFKDGTLTGLFTDYTTFKPCPTCTYGMTITREVVFRIEQEVEKDYRLEKKVNMTMTGKAMITKREETLLT